VTSRHRVSLTRLEVETGWWNNPKAPFIDILCNIFNRLDDKYHFILESQLLQDLRVKYINDYYIIHRICLKLF